MQTEQVTVANKLPGEAVGVQLRGLRKHFGQEIAVDGIDLQIAPGEIVIFLGPSGCGKTTTLRMIAGFETPDDGEVFIGQRPVASKPAYRRDIGMVFQSYGLFPHLTVERNVAFGLELRKVGRAERRARVAELLDMVGLSGFGNRTPAQLSGGQAQRVALARAMATRPKVVLLDEPFGALDRKLRQELQVELRQLQRQINLTTVFVTHDQEEALVLADRIVIMNHGRIEQIGTPRDIYERPRNHFVAGFLGEANFVASTVVDTQDDGTAVCAIGDDFSVSVPSSQVSVEHPHAHSVVDLFVRPENVLIENSHGSESNALAGKVTQRLYVGESFKYEVAITGIGHIWVAVPAPSPTGYEIGDQVKVTFRAGSVSILEDHVNPQ